MDASSQRQEPSKRNIVETNEVSNKEAPIITCLHESKTWNTQEIDSLKGDDTHIINTARDIINMTSTYDVEEDNEEILSKTIHAYTHDCNNWSNVPTKLCFDCDTCKAGILQSSMDHWHKSGKLYVVLVMIMIVQYAFFACYGFKSDN